MKKNTTIDCARRFSLTDLLWEIIKKENQKENRCRLDSFIAEKVPEFVLADDLFIRKSLDVVLSACDARKGSNECLNGAASKSCERFLFVDGSQSVSGEYMLRYSISDNSFEFSEEQLELIENPKKNKSDSVLLALCELKNQFRMKKGFFSVYSAGGGGTLFYMQLPMRIPEEEKEEQQQSWIDPTVAMEYCGGMEDMHLEMLCIFCDQAKKYLEELPIYFEKEDWENYRIVVHAIKGNALSIGSKRFSKESYEQEMAAKAGDSQKIKDTWSDYFAHYKELVEEAKKRIG